MKVTEGRILDPGASDVWRDALCSLPGGDASHDWRWGDVLESAYGWKPYRAVWGEPGSWQAALQFHVFPHRLRRIGISSPFLTTGGLLLSAGAAADKIRADIGKLAGRLGLRHIDLRESGPGAPPDDEEYTFRLALRPQTEMLASFPSKLRSQFRKPAKEGYSVALTAVADLSFYPQFRRKMHEFGTPVHSIRLFREWLSQMPDRCRQFVVKDPAGKVVGGMFMLVAGESASIPFAVVHEPQARSAANMLLYWEAIAHACDLKCATIDFGRSRKGSGTYDFKLQWGCKPIPLVNHRCRPDGVSVTGFGLRGKWAQRFTTVWSHLPSCLADALGPACRRMIP